MLVTLLFFTTLFLAYWNGANDNFKGVATLYGSKTVSYRTAITIATLATFAGSICAIFLANGLVASFSGKGLVPQDIAGASNFLMAVGAGAAFTVLLATRTGFPVSTTHSLVGALIGSGLMAIGLDVNFQQLGNTFFIPLLISPFIAFALAGIFYWISTCLRREMKITKETCLCVGEPRQLVPITNQVNTQANDTCPSWKRTRTTVEPELSVTIAETSDCMEMYTDKVFGINLQKILDIAHGLSAITVSFARGLNDTPKIAGLFVAADTLDIRWGMIAIAMGMAIGGLLNARRVAETISNKITDLNHGQGFSANLVTGLLVIFASKFGVPVSTTHVSVGAIFGIGVVTGKRDASVIRNILLSWLITLPVAMIFSALIYWLIGLL